LRKLLSFVCSNRLNLDPTDEPEAHTMHCHPQQTKI
jgi:hypothetical protein